ncbi:hypothetical protein [Ammoniphilus sp. CFH 90114]|uniref:hypothetical protein n=1 Tax=Ammoniphilus sp. CFH 90114 TaxID=2493665 RepID=UPI00100F0A1D|nr:hypothetical protein [Ammoniphilus sp. CFH 90114]RXT08706.1 hypothetical protein EIZ39_07820 [Ammoniphilus sp. CFH 90114]
MTYSIYSSIGSTFGKLLKAKSKPIILSKTVSERPAPFLQGFAPGATTIKALEEGVIDEIAEDVFETIFTLSLDYKGLTYTVTISEAKDCWILKDIRHTGKVIRETSRPRPTSPKKKKPVLTLSFFLLILISVSGYIYEFKLNKEHEPESNPTVYEAFSSKEEPESQENIIEPQEAEVDKPLSDWEKEKAELEAKIASLQQENEELKKQLTEAIPFTFEPGMNALQLAQAVQDAGLVANGQEFNESLVKFGAIEHLSPGTYLVVPGSSHEQLIEVFTRGVIKKIN